MIKIKKILIILFLSLILFNIVPAVSSICNENQIDINIAEIKELDKIINIGEVLAQRIVDSRPFSSIDDLIRVKGIGNITLQEIEEQNLACVNLESSQINENFVENINASIKKNITEELISTNNSNLKSDINKENTESNPGSKISDITYLQGIILNSKDIKTDKTKPFLEKIPLYGIILLGFILILLILNKRKKLKNELQ